MLDNEVRSLRITTPALCAAVVAFCLALTSAPSAEAAVVAANTPVYWCTSTTATCTTPFATAAGRAKMVCWTDDRIPTGYRYPRWFYVRTASGVTGFVKAETVRRQVRKPNCSTRRGLRATAWGLGQVGSAAYQLLCLQFTYDAYINTGTRFPGPLGPNVTAWQWWNAQPAGRRNSDLNPPRGALVFWQPVAGNPEGHVALSIGNGWAVSTREGGTNEIHLLNIAQRNAVAPYAGWVSWIGKLV
jgi:hypothetical protein